MFHPTFLVLILAVAQQQAVSQQPALSQQPVVPSSPQPEGARAPLVLARPRDPFVFRCVLDQRVRIVTLALSEDLWAAYDTTTCGFYKAWKGGVKFDGAVYTTVHGPTPTSLGADYTRGLDGKVWIAREKDVEVEARAVWRGYRIDHGACVLSYDVVLADGRAIRVEERPESMRSDEVFSAQEREDYGVEPGMPGLVRRFHAPAVPAGVVVAVQVRSDASKGRFIDAGGAAQERLIDRKGADGQPLAPEIHSYLWLDANRKTNSLIQFYDPIVLPPPTEHAADANVGNGASKSKDAKGGVR